MTRCLSGLIFLAVSTAAPAQTLVGIWQADGKAIAAKDARISVPRTVGGLTLISTREYQQPGTALDNGALYRSPDEQIWATLYVYRPGYPDAALADYAADRVVRATYGDRLRRVDHRVVPFAGHADGAIRTAYRDVMQKNGDLSASTSLIGRIGNWIVKLRVSGPMAKADEVDVVSEAFAREIKLSKGANLHPVAILDFSTACPAAPSGPVIVTMPKDVAASALESAIGAQILDPTDTVGTPLPLGFPADGKTKVCVRGSVAVGDRKLDVLQPAGPEQPDTILAVINDSGSTFAVTKSTLGPHFAVSTTAIGTVTVYRTIDRLPDDAEFGRIAAGQVPGLLTVQAKVEMNRSGDSTITVTKAEPKSN
ncbi:MAG: hypothetical protein V4659_04795 [Pseudomonadota bacterium]